MYAGRTVFFCVAVCAPFTPSADWAKAFSYPLFAFCARVPSNSLACPVTRRSLDAGTCLVLGVEVFCGLVCPRPFAIFEIGPLSKISIVITITSEKKIYPPTLEASLQIGNTTIEESAPIGVALDKLSAPPP